MQEGAGKDVLLREVSSYQRCLLRGVPLISLTYTSQLSVLKRMTLMHC